ncbi:MAG: ribonuclease P protein component [Syntrophomonadaceae bacterium]|nr:ribonuclease P protein component [Syntrophomonadaceae bacterium]
MLHKEARIRTGREYRQVYQDGKRLVGKYIIIYWKENQRPVNRFGIVTSKKVGQAVIRNRAKRQLRAIARSSANKIRGNYDIVVVARTSIKDSAFEMIEKDFQLLIKRARLC